MAIISLQVANFRCIERAELDFDPRSTLIVGENAAGKTSILEAIHTLSAGRSFRTSKNELLVRGGELAEFVITGKAVQNFRTLTLGLKWRSEGKEIHLNGARNRGFAELAAALPVQVIDPGAHKLLEEGPSQRRRFVDWGVFHVEQQFVGVWRAYNTALNQRNAALKSQQSSSLVRSWDEQLANLGEQICHLRQHYVENLASPVDEIAKELLGVSVRLAMKKGWSEGVSLAESLALSWSRDLRYRNTSVGPHRADLYIEIDGVTAKDRVSRGQQKLLACALVLAQLRYHVDSGMPPACLLLDDPAAELDVHNLGKLLQLVVKIPAQLIATAVDSKTLNMIAAGKMFHVKQGYVTPMV
jgi:DNA replication and repair protein RecF